MNLLYWNLKSNKNYNYIVSLIKGYSIDVAIFSEYKLRDKSSVFDGVYFDGYQFHPGNGGCDKVIMLAKNDIHVEINREQSRYAIYSVVSRCERYNVVGVHLPPNPYDTASSRKIVIRDIISDLKEQESKNGHSNSIIIGDLNASPFDSELIDKDGFNAVLYREIIENKSKVKFKGKYNILF